MAKIKQKKLSPYWDLKEGDKVKGKKIVKINFYEDKYSENHFKIIQLEDVSEYLLEDKGLKKFKSK